MLAAVPAGDHDVRIDLDLAPVFGPLSLTRTLRIEPPPPDAFDRRLAELRSGDPDVRRKAVADLPYFGRERKRVGPALVGCLSDADGIVRRLTLATLQGFPQEAAAHVDEVLRILESREGRVSGERTNAALLLSRTAPASDRVQAALERSIEGATEWESRIFRSALDAYRERCGAADR